MNPQAETFLTRLIAFGICASHVAVALEQKRYRHIATQLHRSATAPAALYAEACDAESRSDFVHKLKVCLKELRESGVWLAYARGFGVRSHHLDVARAECSELTANGRSERPDRPRTEILDRLLE